MKRERKTHCVLNLLWHLAGLAIKMEVEMHSHSIYAKSVALAAPLLRICCSARVMRAAEHSDLWDKVAIC